MKAILDTGNRALYNDRVVDSSQTCITAQMLAGSKEKASEKYREKHRTTKWSRKVSMIAPTHGIVD
jgi:hypothetical protein